MHAFAAAAAAAAAGANVFAAWLTETVKRDWRLAITDCCQHQRASLLLLLLLLRDQSDPCTTDAPQVVQPADILLLHALT
jgi:hypothetical protein